MFLFFLFKKTEISATSATTFYQKTGDIKDKQCSNNLSQLWKYWEILVGLYSGWWKVLLSIIFIEKSKDQTSRYKQ